MSETHAATHLVLIRHGATVSNEAKPPRLQGAGIDLELSAAGEQQAAALAELLPRFAPAAVYSSHLRRARQTAERIAAACGLENRLVENLQETAVGQWEGKDWPTIEREFPEAFRLFKQDCGTHPHFGGESYGDVQRRIEPLLLDLMHRHAGKTFAVVAHGVVNRTFLAKYLPYPLHQAPSIPQMNGCINVIRSLHGKIRVLTYNSILHLPPWPE